MQKKEKNDLKFLRFCFFVLFQSGCLRLRFFLCPVLEEGPG